MSAAGRDLVSGVVVLVFCIAIYIAIPYQVAIEDAGNLTAASVPIILLVTIGLLSVILLGRGFLALRGKEADGSFTDGPTDRKALLYVGSVAGGLIVYVIAIPWLGYLLSTGLILGVLTLLYGQRVFWQILLLMIIAPPISFYFFRYTMFVLLPQGRLFD